MPVHIHPGTMPGGVTPICGCCGISLCWDISDQDYAEAKPFWDSWICQDCNGGERLSLKGWQATHSVEPPSAGPRTEAEKLDTFSADLLRLSVEDPPAYEKFLADAATVLQSRINDRTAMANALCAIKTLSVWEQSFVADMRRRAIRSEKGITGWALLTMTKKQRDCLTRIHTKYCATR